MIPGKANIDIYRGDDLAPLPITFRTGTPGSYTARDMSGYTWECQARTTVDSTDVALTFTVDDSQAADGILFLTAAAADTALLVADQSLRWDLQSTADGKIQTWLYGQVFVTGDATR